MPQVRRNRRVGPSPPVISVLTAFSLPHRTRDRSHRVSEGQAHAFPGGCGWVKYRECPPEHSAVIRRSHGPTRSHTALAPSTRHM